MIHKQILVSDRVRRPPTDGWSWIDRRFLREHAPRLSHEAIVLYFFLAAVSDKDGLSFYGDASIAVRLRMEETTVVAGRDELVAADLVAYRRRWRRCSPCPPPRSNVAAVVWPPSARSFAAWPIPLHLPIHGGPHESLSLGGNPPFARDRRSHGPRHCPPLALLYQDHRQGVGHAVAPHTGSGAKDKYSRPLPRGSRPWWPSTPIFPRCESRRRYPRERAGIEAACTRCGVICTRSDRQGDACIRRCSTSRARPCRWIGATADA